MCAIRKVYIEEEWVIWRVVSQNLGRVSWYTTGPDPDISSFFSGMLN